MNCVLESRQRLFFGCFHAKRWALGGAGLMWKCLRRADSGSEIQPLWDVHCTSLPSGAHLVDGKVNLMTGSSCWSFRNKTVWWVMCLVGSNLVMAVTVNSPRCAML